MAINVPRITSSLLNLSNLILSCFAKQILSLLLLLSISIIVCIVILVNEVQLQKFQQLCRNEKFNMWVFFFNLLIKFLIIFMSCNLNTSVSFPLHEKNQYQQFCWCEFKFVLKSVDIESSFPNT